MLNDIAKIYSDNGWETILICGSLPPVSDGFTTTHRFTVYDRSGFLRRFFSWRKFTLEVKQFVKSSGNVFSRAFLVSNPPFNLYLVNFFKKFNPTSEVDLLVYDLYPDILSAYAGKWTNPFLFPWRKLNQHHFSYADQIFTPSIALSDAVRKYFKGPIDTVYNWVDVSSIKPVDKQHNLFLSRWSVEPSFITVLYSGNLGATHDAATLASAIEATERKSLAFLFVGHGAGIEYLQRKLKGDQRICFPGWQAEDMFPYSIASGDVALISYLPGAEGYSIPSKLPYYFASGTPVIMVGNPTSALAMLILENKLGWVVKNNDVKELSSLFNSLSDDMLISYRQNVLAFVQKEWSMDNAKMFYRI